MPLAPPSSSAPPDRASTSRKCVEDAYRSLGEHSAWADVLRTVRIRLIWEMTFSTMLH